MKNILKKLGLTLISMTLLMNNVAELFGGNIEIHSDNQGWVNSLGEGNGAIDGNNTFTGNEFTHRFNSWASFSIPSLSSLFTSATLEMTLTPAEPEFPAIYTIGIYDVNTPFSSFEDNTSGIAGYTDLGSGALYGSVAGFDGLVSVTLSAQALADINASQGAVFILGFTNITLNGEISAENDDIGVYPNGSGSGEPRLILAVPEPSTNCLLSLGAIMTAIAIRRSRMRGSNGALAN